LGWSGFIRFGNDLTTLELAAAAAIRYSGCGNPFLDFIVFFFRDILDHIFFFIFVGTAGCNSGHS
jgi:hypothetical protein